MKHKIIVITKTYSFGTIDIENCARCEKDHKGLDMLRFTLPPGEATHYSICPETGEPILITAKENEDRDKQ